MLKLALMIMNNQMITRQQGYCANAKDWYHEVDHDGQKCSKVVSHKAQEFLPMVMDLHNYCEVDPKLCN